MKKIGKSITHGEKRITCRLRNTGEHFSGSILNFFFREKTREKADGYNKFKELNEQLTAELALKKARIDAIESEVSQLLFILNYKPLKKILAARCVTVIFF